MTQPAIFRTDAKNNAAMGGNDRRRHVNGTSRSQVLLYLVEEDLAEIFVSKRPDAN